jgi:hypothetical protein
MVVDGGTPGSKTPFNLAEGFNEDGTEEPGKRFGDTPPVMGETIPVEPIGVKVVEI